MESAVSAVNCTFGGNCVESVDEIGSGFFGSVYKVNLATTKEKISRPDSVVVKVLEGKKCTGYIANLNNASITESWSKFASDHWLSCLFQCEEAAYVVINKIAISHVPKLLGSCPSIGQKPATLIIEDLTEISKVVDPDYFSSDQVTTLIKFLAEVHAKSLTSNSWRDRMPKSLELHLAEFYSYITKITTIDKVMALGPDFEIVKSFVQYLEPSYVSDTMFCAKENPNWPRVLVHGDFFPDNTLWEPMNASRLVGVIDWQFGHVGSCMEDLARILVSSEDCDALSPSKINQRLESYLTEVTSLYPEFSLNIDELRQALHLQLPFVIMEYALCLVRDLEAVTLECDKQRHLKIGMARFKALEALVQQM